MDSPGGRTPTARMMLRPASLWALLALAPAAAASPAHAELKRLPLEVQEEVAANIASCGSRAANIEVGFATSLDINDDRVPDYMLNYKHLLCGERRGFCGSVGCLVQVFVSSKSKKFEKVIDEDVWHAELRKTNRRATLVLGLHGAACEQPYRTPCEVTFAWNGTKFVKRTRR